MLRRLVVGLVLGLIIGGVMAFALVQGLKIHSFDVDTGGATLAYLFSALTGVVTGLIAGKPIWAAGGKIEAGLKAFFGGLLAVGAMFALRKWGAGWELNLSAIGAGEGPVGTLPAASLPLVAIVLSTFFELDNTEPKAPSPRGSGTDADGVKKVQPKAGANGGRAVAERNLTSAPSARGAGGGPSARSAGAGKDSSRVVTEPDGEGDEPEATPRRAKR